MKTKQFTIAIPLVVAVVFAVFAPQTMAHRGAYAPDGCHCERATGERHCKEKEKGDLVVSCCGKGEGGPPLLLPLDQEDASG
ncbi:MAG: hypothetical protein ISN28_08340 [Ectothiorhodospiraceae bacterium AqS1]|nr:hypothetical protein [Ectothiorhodospiraceae bacterium AqS1]